jgi:probable phosphoglycerate mutase
VANLTTVFVVRHGRTALNAQGRYRGLDDPPLDDVGREQAEEAAWRIHDRSILAVEHSPLLRAAETAAAIARVAGVEPAVNEGLVDLDHGAWTGRLPEEAERHTPDELRLFREDPRACTPPGGEPLAEVERRVMEALDDLGRRFPGGEVVAVSHEIPIRLLVSRLQGLDGATIWTLPLGTGSVTTVVGGPSVWRLG